MSGWCTPLTQFSVAWRRWKSYTLLNSNDLFPAPPLLTTWFFDMLKWLQYAQLADFSYFHTFRVPPGVTSQGTLCPSDRIFSSPAHFFFFWEFWSLTTHRKLRRQYFAHVKNSHCPSQAASLPLLRLMGWLCVLSPASSASQLIEFSPRLWHCMLFSLGFSPYDEFSSNSVSLLF